MNLVDFIFQAVRSEDLWRQPALYYEQTTITYIELIRMVKRCRGMLRDSGIQTGERVAILLPDCPEFIIAFLGTAANGSVAVPLSTRASADGLLYALRHCRAAGLITTSDQLENLGDVKAALPDIRKIWLVEGASPDNPSFRDTLAGSPEQEVVSVNGDDLAFILYTSGSTAKPKGVMHLHRALPFTVNAGCRQILDVKPDDRLFSSSKLFFAYGLGNSLSFPLSTGAASILVSDKPAPNVIAKTFADFHPTIFFGVPSVFRELCRWLEGGDRLETESLKFCVSAGEKLPADLFHRWRSLTGLEILDGIGSTEMLQMFISSRRGGAVPGACGTPVPGYEAVLIDPEGAEISGPGTGEVLVKGGSASPGYWRDPDNTAATMRGDWIRTGDIFERTQDGLYWHQGRADDLFKVKGQWVSPIEVEEAILQSDQVLEAAVVCGTDSEGMNAPIAFVVLKPGLLLNADTVAELTADLTRKLPAFKRPAEFVLMDQLPRTETGKLQRFKLRDGLRAGHEAQPGDPGRQPRSSGLPRK